jgi:signal transduction histidine kinase
VKVLETVREDLHDALDRLRSVANEVYPSLLDAWGLPDALREAARSLGVTMRLDAPDLPRRVCDVEAGAYFCCRSALQEAAHADEAVDIRLRRDGEGLRVEIDRRGTSVAVATFTPQSEDSER